ncbi:Ribosome biogenesis ytm1 [Lecanosticta acicola]|uniref:Ribosome biogenesis protein YTM1 n=1 Tax=Lecanosticta acicola TaxID=111012 RepID=A0AAI9E863_9PEZI|nr:Ribosome biogenesis ytm1 [Lecanosticta acicola]
MAAQAGAERTAQVRIHLKTNDEEITLSQETGPILVSTELKRYQLSTLVNTLLETEKPIPLEFLINGQFLRTSLDEFLTQNGISAETTLSVEYVKALVPPLHVASFEHDDWISSVDVLSGSAQSRILSASFDGNLRVWNLSSQILATGEWHRARPNDAKFLSNSQVVSAGIDRSVMVWDFQDSATGTEKGMMRPKLELCGHKSAVESLAVDATSSRVLSASQDNRIGLWTTKKSEAPAAPPSAATEHAAPNKRRKLSGPAISVPQRGALAMLESHRDFVKAVTFDQKDHTVAYSASQDHTVKTWDLPTATCVDTRTTGQSLSALCHLPETSLLAAGGAERYINLIDPRASATKVSTMILKGHTGWINSLSRDPQRDYQFVSGSNDGTCRIWDLRSGRHEASGEKVGQAVFVIERESQSQKGGGKAAQGDAARVFSVCWDRDVGIVSAGRDKMLQINKAP